MQNLVHDVIFCVSRVWSQGLVNRSGSPLKYYQVITTRGRNTLEASRRTSLCHPGLHFGIWVLVLNGERVLVLHDWRRTSLQSVQSLAKSGS